MGILQWIVDSYNAALVSARLDKEQKKYYWVAEKHRKKCNKIIQDANRDRNVLILPWDKWNDCMQQVPRPVETYRVVQQLTFIVNFIKELVGINTGKEKFKEKVEVKDLPPKTLPPPTPKKPKPPAKPEKVPAEPKPKKKPVKKIPAEKKKVVKVGPASGLNFNLFDFSIRSDDMKKFINKTFLNKVMNINKKMLEEIDNINPGFEPPRRKNYSYLYTDVCRFDEGIFNTDKFS